MKLKLEKNEDEIIIIRKNKVTSKNFYKIISFDSEANRFKQDFSDRTKIVEVQKFFKGCFYDGNNYYFINNQIEFYSVINGFLNTYKKVTIIIHNMLYDLRITGFLKDLFNGKTDYKIDKLYLGNVNYIKLKENKKELIFLDTFNYFKTSLRILAKSFNMEKYTTTEEYHLEPDEWNKYLKTNYKELLRSDVLILYKVFQAYLNMEYCNGITIASTSFNEIIKLLPHNLIYQKSFDPISKKIYRGANTYVYKAGIFENIYYYDINSLYPYVMKKYKYSYKFHRKVEQSEFDNLINLIEKNDYNYIVNCTWTHKENQKRNPVLSRIDGKLIMLKNHSGFITGNEYKYLLDNGYTVLVLESYEFLADYLFRDFVDKFYQLKKNSTGFKRDFNKLILNTGYGKTGQHKSGSEIIFNSKIEDQDLLFKTAYFMAKKLEKMQFTVNDKQYSIYPDFISSINEEDFKYNPIIASEITANSRLENFAYQKKYDFDNMILTDTDSFLSFVKFRDIDVSDNELGKVKLEMFVDKLTVYTQKDYVLEWHLENNSKNREKYKNFIDKKTEDILYLKKEVHKGIPLNHIQNKNNFTFTSFNTFKNQYSLTDIAIKQISKDEIRIAYKYNYEENRIWNDEKEFLENYKLVEEMIKIKNKNKER